MKVTETVFQNVQVLEPEIFFDERGHFFESFNQKTMNDLIGSEIIFVQDNQSRSKKGVLRGMHYQLPPMDQGKLIRVISGEIYDVVVDLRQSSKTFGQWFGVTLSEKNKKLIYIPSGFAHGFLTISDVADVLYKTTTYYAPDFERSFLWNDPEVNISWPGKTQPLLSDKDKHSTSFSNNVFFD